MEISEDAPVEEEALGGGHEEELAGRDGGEEQHLLDHGIVEPEGADGGDLGVVGQ